MNRASDSLSFSLVEIKKRELEESAPHKMRLTCWMHITHRESQRANSLNRKREKNKNYYFFPSSTLLSFISVVSVRGFPTEGERKDLPMQIHAGAMTAA